MGAKASTPELHSFKDGHLVKGVPVTAKVWRIGEGQAFPELEALPELKGRAQVGLALSGGGIRACCESYGLLQAVQAMGLMPKVRYIASNSGSSWINAPFSFLPEEFDVETFLGGAPLGPEQLTLEVLDNLPTGSFMKAAAEAKPTKDFVTSLVQMQIDTERLKAWNQAVTGAYLRPFKLFEEGTVMSAPEGTEWNERTERAIAGTSAKITPMRKDAPFPIFTACLSDLANEGGTGGPWFPLEFTPLYCGAPLLFETPGGIIGGGLIESVGFGSKAPELEEGRTEVRNKEEVNVQPTHFISVGYSAGVSATAGAVAIKDASAEKQQALGYEVLDLWSPADVASKNNRLTNVMDGGPMDNTAILALLRRHCPKIIAQVAELRPATDPAFVEQIWWASLFGRAQVGISRTAADRDELNERGHVFPAEKFDELVAGLQQKIAAGEPTVVEQQMKVLENKRAGVKGGYKVKIIWVLAGCSQRFREKLPEESRALLERPVTHTGNIKNVDIVLRGQDIDESFPFEKTFYGHYTPRLVRMLAENTAYNLMCGAHRRTAEGYFAEGMLRAATHTLHLR